MLGFIIPKKSNNHTPYLLSKSAMIIYILVIFSLNFVFPQVGVFKIKADITTQELLEQHNEVRQQNGLRPLKLNSKLINSATYKSFAMVETDCWSHYCPDGKSPWEFFDQAGYVYLNAGENLAEGFTDVDTVMSAWLNSETHKENILNPNFDEIGFGFGYGYYQGRENNIVVTAHFGKALKSTVAAADISVSDSSRSITINRIENVGKGEKNSIEVTGNVLPENSTVKINVNDSEVGRVLASGSNYTYRSKTVLEDGSYKVNAELLDLNNNSIAISADEYKVLDHNKPKILNDSVNIEIENNLVTINLLTTKDTLLVTSDVKAESERPVEQGIFKIQYLKESIQNHNAESITITLLDRSGNESVYRIKKSVLTDKITASNLESESIQIDQVNFVNSNFRYFLIIGIIFYLVILLFVDFLVLSKRQMLSAVNRKSHLQFAVLIILLIILNVSGFGGTILNGTAI